MSLPRCFGPWMIIGIMMNFHFMHIQGGRLNIHKVTGQVLKLNGSNPSVLKPNRMFLVSFANSGNYLSINLHCDPSVGCLILSSFLRSCLCQHIIFTLALHLNRHFSHGITGKYHTTFAGIFFFFLFFFFFTP
jgi:hypothetical protein